jgi:hypothetical protein
MRSYANFGAFAHAKTVDFRVGRAKSIIIDRFARAMLKVGQAPSGQ